MEIGQTSRIDWLDILKGIAIILVVLGHIPCVGDREAFLNRLIYSFHMDLFFALAGYTAALSYCKTNKAFTFIKKRILTLLVPYIAWCALRVFVFDAGNASSMESFFELLRMGSGTLWFIPALFVVQLVFVLYMVVAGRSPVRRLVFALFFAGLMLCYHRCGCPFIMSIISKQPAYLSPIFTYSWPFAFGVFMYLCPVLWGKIARSSWIATLCLCAYVPLCVTYQDLPLSAYGHIVVGVSGTLLVLKLLVYTPGRANGFLTQYSEHPVMRQLSFVGKHSLGIYLLSDFLMPAAPFLPEYAGFPEFMAGFVYSIAVAYCCIIFEYFLCLSPALATVFYGKTYFRVKQS